MEKIFDYAIVGGGLAGLSISILLAKKGKSVVLFEKETYPQHKVCGEYISMESWPFLESIGLALSEMDLPRISKLHISTPSGFLLKSKLDLGGFGISRYLLDEKLFLSAQMAGVEVYTSTKVENIEKGRDMFILSTSRSHFTAHLVMGSWGKRSNIDLKWGRDFAIRQKSGLTNHVGVKYHIRTDFPSDLIELHNFKDGYCGISKVEGERFCLCYLTTAENIRKYGGIKEMEEAVLWRNPHLKRYLNESEFLYDKPLTISQISFLPKKTEEHGVLMIGDAAGMIAPLCGNGMSMSLRSAKMLAHLMDGSLGKKTISEIYQNEWKQAFSTRLFAGRAVQQLFGKEWLTEVVVRSLAPFPFLVNGLVKMTHGDVY